jgi:type IV pilus assembly protein PilW
MENAPNFAHVSGSGPINPAKMAGLSLIELMIALLLGVILTLGVTQVYLGTSQTYRLTDAIAHTQENIRFASSIMQRDVRGTGGFACLQNEGDVTVKLQGARVVPLGDGILGWEAAGTGIGDEQDSEFVVAADGSAWSEGGGAGIFPAELAGEVVAGNDVLIVNSVQTLPVEVTGSTGVEISMDGATGIPSGRIVLAVTDDCAAGELFQKANNATASSVTAAGTAPPAPGNSNATISLNYIAGAKIASHSTAAYYIGVGTSGAPSLFRQRLDTAPEGPQELVEGVESMQVLYGVSTGTLKQANVYRTAADVTNWQNVVSVRVAFIARSANGANSEDVTRVFNLLGTEVTAPTDRRARFVSTSTIGIRNRLE